MKRSYQLTLILIVLAVLCMGAFLETRQLVWVPARSAIGSDDTALDGTTASYTYQFADKPAAAISLNPEYNGGELYFYGTDAEDEASDYKVWVWKANGPARLWCYGTATLGAALQGTGSYYADTITSTNVTGITQVFDSGNDRVCTLRLGDMTGIRFLYVEFDVDTVATISAEFTGW